MLKRIRVPYRKKTNNNIRVWVLGVERKFDRSVYKPPFKLKKMFWYDEYADSDPFTPSCPHLHSLVGKYKLNVYNGEIYNNRLKRIEKSMHVSKDELKKLWNDSGFQKFAEVMRNQYFQKFPKGKLPQIPF